LQYLSEALAASDPTLFTNYVAWLKVLFSGLGFPEQALTTTLESMRDVLREELPPELAEVPGSYIHQGFDLLPQAVTTPPSHLAPQAPLSGLAAEYLEALLRAERHVASQLILDAVQAGTSVKEIYLHVFQPTQHELGRLWQMNRLTVAQEHYCTAATQLIMSQLYPYIFRTERVGRRLVATCVGGELHEIGVRMVADFFEMEGWDTYYLGANAPLEAILQAVAEREAGVLALSATMTFHVSTVAALIGGVRADTARAQVAILVGGRPFNQSRDLWQRVGADAWAPDAQSAIAAANRLVAGSG
jgi:methanogenic corrinoid protein MtbC1